MISPRHNPSTPRDGNSNLYRSYGSNPAHKVTMGLAARHKLHSAATADYYFSIGHYSDCAAVCEAILESDPLPAEAIRARCHMYLAMEGVGSRLAPRRLSHAWKAIELWNIVVERRGVSRFPIAKAREEREEARLLVEAVEAEGEQMDTPMMEDVELEEGEIPASAGEEEGFKA